MLLNYEININEMGLTFKVPMDRYFYIYVNYKLATERSDSSQFTKIGSRCIKNTCKTPTRFQPVWNDRSWMVVEEKVKW